jgi:Protein of unknown function (DUF3575)
MKYPLSMIVGLCLTLSVKGQDTISNRWIAKVNVTSLMNPTFPAIKLGLEKQVSQNLSVSGEIGYSIINANNQVADTFFFKPHGFSGNIETRYYLKAKKITKKPVHNYMAVNIFYISEQYNSSVEYINIADTSYLSFKSDNFTVNKKKWGVNFIYGKQKQFTKRWIVDAYIGLGLRQKTIVNTHKEYDNKKHEIAAVDFQFRYLDLSDTSGVNLNFIIGVRLGFILK